MKYLLCNLDVVEPLVVVASLIVTVGVFIYSFVTIEETASLGRMTTLSNKLARLLCIPLPVIATILALVYVCIPNQQWLVLFSFIIIALDLLVILAFGITVIPALEKKPTTWSIDSLLPQFEDAQSEDLEKIKKLASE